MPFIPFLTIAAAAVVGEVVSISSSIAQSNAAEEEAQAQKDLLAQQATAKTDAAATAQQAATDRRRSILATGGETDVTGGTATLGAGSTKKTILGA